MITERASIRLWRDYAADWTASNPVLAEGEPGFERDTGLLKIGDGVTAWNALAYFEPGGGGGAGTGDAAWTNASGFVNSWVTPYSAGYGVVKFRKDGQGFVHIEGTAKNGANAATVFTLPAGYRPDHTLNFPVASQNAGGQLTIDTAGVVQFFGSGSSPTAFLSFDGISFYAGV